MDEVKVACGIGRRTKVRGRRRAPASRDQVSNELIDDINMFDAHEVAAAARNWLTR